MLAILGQGILVDYPELVQDDDDRRELEDDSESKYAGCEQRDIRVQRYRVYDSVTDRVAQEEIK